jgi:serine/threonine protein kinase/thioredoxin-like negative regulator of GroEL
MTPERYKEVGDLYRTALELAPERRPAFLAEACIGDETLRKEVESLLGYEAQRGSLIDQPALEVAAKVLAEERAESLVGQSVGHYQVLSLLGKGGMGDVFLGEDTRLKRKVAIKRLPPPFTANRERLRRFEQEAQAASSLNHPNIITIYEVAEASAMRYLVTEYIEGETLRRRMAREKMTLGEVLDVALQIASALTAAHTRGIVHRDIKPENVMVRPDGLVKVLDFGLSKLTERSAPPVDLQAPTDARPTTEPGLVIGTVSYMSPEQARGFKVDHRTDIFSLGVMLYEMFAGRRPFEGETTSDVIAAVLTQEPEPLRKYNNVVVPELERVTLKCLAKERDERWQTVGELAEALKETQRRNEQPTRRAFFFARPVWLTAALTLVLLSSVAYWRQAQRASSRPQIKSLAVLPLENLSGDPSQEFFADGMTEALISNLAQIRALRVISRTSVMRFKGSRKPLPEIARELNVDVVLAGSVQRSGRQVKISAQLIQAATDTHLWAREYGHELQDVLKLQGEVARAVADEVRIQVTAEERARLASARSVDPEAHQEYLLGRYHYWKLNEEDLKRAIEHFERAILVVPDYAPAFAGLSDAWQARGTWGTKTLKEVEVPARAAVLKALALDNNLAEAHASLGQIKFFYDWDWSGAVEELERALVLDPGNLTAHHDFAQLLLVLGHLSESISHIESAERLDPLSSAVQSTFGRILYRARRYPEAIDHLKRAVELNPGNNGAYARLADVYEEMGRYEEAMAALEKAQALGEVRLYGSTGYKARLARVYARTGRRREALRTIQELKATLAPSRFPRLAVAAVYTALGDKDEAFRLLIKTVEEHDQLNVFIKVDPPFQSLHSDPRWKALLHRLNVPEE